MEYKNLTKSLMSIAFKCPRKLYYHTNPEIYQNENIADPFLEALAEGGFQVGALAKIYHPEGVDLENLSTEDALIQTKALLTQAKVTIFEATFIYDNLLVKIDILKKDGNQIELLEVKAKSFDEKQDHFFHSRGKLKLIKEWEPYLVDVAYQMYVCSKACPEIHFKPFLYLIDQHAKASVDGLNQKFMLDQSYNKTTIKINPDTNINTVGEKLLIKVDVATAVDFILENRFVDDYKANCWDVLPFEVKILELSRSLKYGQKLTPRLDSQCRKCEFRVMPMAPLQSGFKECWSTKVAYDQLEAPFVFDVWYYGSHANQVLNTNRILMQELTQDDFKINNISSKSGLTRGERQWIQVKFTEENKKYFDQTNLAKKLATWKYPLHFIDFETSRVALPFSNGQKPYEQIAFQFSHHVVDFKGNITHQGQYLNDLPGQFPNFDFVRQLKKQLEVDKGTIFRYANHENSVLCDIITQLECSAEPDRDQLIEWIKTITQKDQSWLGARNMVDLYNMVINYFYHPLMKDSNSLKSVLPAILSDSKKLQAKYSLPIYGSAQFKSLNFKNYRLIQYDQEGAVQDPYQLLPKLFSDVEIEPGNHFFQGDEINHGGAAMTAYAKMQFTTMPARERQILQDGLLKYCELDTFAMVLLYEYFVENINCATA
ncbi:MAG: DUF2779 domain-containing protein [Gammaproteobacteria bacterium]